MLWSAQGFSSSPAWRDRWRERISELAFPLQSDESSPCLQNRGCRVRVLPALSPVFMRKLRLPGISGRPFAPRDFVSELSIIAGHPNGKPDE